MADTLPGEPSPPVPPGPSPVGGGGPLPPAGLQAPLTLAPAMPGAAVGLPAVELPPLVEPSVVGFDDAAEIGPPAEIRPPAISRRPVRRRFLPPVAPPADDRDGLPFAREARPRTPPRQLAPPLEAAEPRGRQAGPREKLARSPRQSAAAAASPSSRRWRLVLVAAGVAAALSMVTAFEVGVSVERLMRLPGTVLHLLPGPRAQPGSGKPPADPARRVAYYGERAEAGDAAAQVALAVLYAKGDGVRQDYAKAAAWLRRAAEQGVTRAQYDLGVLYERGRGVPIDYVQAVSWYRKAAEQNHPLAQYNLAVAFTKGEGVRRNLSEAAVWYHRAAAQGVVAAMVNLAILYERGDGVEASTADAYAWYRAASQRGNAPAALRADQLLRAFSTWEQTRAEAKVADVAASIHDAQGARARLAARTPSAARSEPVLKSGIGSGRTAEPDAAGESP